MNNTKEFIEFGTKPNKGEIWLVKIGSGLQLLEREVVEVRGNAVRLKLDATYLPPAWYKTSDVEFVEQLK